MAKAKHGRQEYSILNIDKPHLYIPAHPYSLFGSRLFRTPGEERRPEALLLDVFVVIASLAYHNKWKPGWCTATNETLAEWMVLSVQTISNNVMVLVRRGLLESVDVHSRKRKMRPTVLIDYILKWNWGLLKPEEMLDDAGKKELVTQYKRNYSVQWAHYKPAYNVLLNTIIGVIAYREIEKKEKTIDRESRNSISTASPSLGQGLDGKTPTRENTLDGKTPPARPNSQPRDGAHAPERPGKANSNLTRDLDTRPAVTEVFERYVRKHVTGGGEPNAEQVSQCITATRQLYKMVEKEGWLDTEHPKLPIMVNGSAEENLRYLAQCYCEFITNKQFKDANLCAGHFMPKPKEPERVKAFLKWLRRDYSGQAEQEPKPTVQQQKEKPPMSEKERERESRRRRG